MEHTPAPWNVNNQRQNGVQKYWIQSATDKEEEINSNARLIAAAPDLLEALEALFRECALIHKYGGEISNNKQADAAIAAARAAISKARGE